MLVVVALRLVDTVEVELGLVKEGRMSARVLEQTEAAAADVQVLCEDQQLVPELTLGAFMFAIVCRYDLS